MYQAELHQVCIYVRYEKGRKNHEKGRKKKGRAWALRSYGSYGGIGNSARQFGS